MKSRLFALAALAVAACATQQPASAPSSVPSAAPAAGPPAPLPEGWEDMPAKGITLRAIGQEPGWILEMFADRVDLSYDYGRSNLSAPRPEPVVGSDGAQVFTLSPEGRRIRIETRQAPCTDVMSGEIYPATVTIFIDGRRLDGCGASR